jgi:hypothetical protein
VSHWQPGSNRRSIPLDPQHSSSCTVDQDLAEKDVAAFTDPQQLRLASGRVLPRHKSRPRSEVPSHAESNSVTDGRDDGCCHDWPDPWDLPYTSAVGVRGGDPLQLVLRPSSTHPKACASAASDQHLRSRGISGIASRSFDGVLANSMPRSSRNGTSYGGSSSSFIWRRRNLAITHLWDIANGVFKRRSVMFQNTRLQGSPLRALESFQ